MNGQIEIHKYSKEQVPVITDLIIDLLKDFNERSGSNFSVERDTILLTIEKLTTRDSFECYIAFQDQIPLGLITIVPCFAIYNGGDFGVITELYVDRKKRSSGIGKMLLHKAIEYSKLQGWTKLEVGAPDSSQWPRTIQFYKKNGFVEKEPKLRIDL